MRHRGIERLQPAALVALTLALAYGGGFWLHIVHELGGATEPGAPSSLMHWLRDSTLLVPIVLVAGWSGLLVWRRFLRPAQGAQFWDLSGASMAASVAFAVSVAEGLVSPVHTMVFGGHHAGQQTQVFVPSHMVSDGLVALTGNLLVAGIVVFALGRHVWTDRSATPWRTLLLRVNPLRLRLAAVSAATVVAATGSLGWITPTAVRATEPTVGPCPTSAPLKTFDISAIDVKMWLDRHGTHDPEAQMYVPNSRIAAVRSQEAIGPRSLSIGLRDDAIQPLAIRANQGDCVRINFTNATTRAAPRASSHTYGLHIDGLEFAMSSSGDAIGTNAPSDVAPGASATYTFYVPDDPRLEGAHYIHPGPGNRQAVAHGLFGTLTVEPPGSTYLNMTTGQPQPWGWEAIIVPGSGKAFRENVKVLHEIGNEDERQIPLDLDGERLPTVDPHTGAYRPGTRAMNYRAEAFMPRLDAAEDQKATVYSSYTFGDTSNLIARGYLGDPTKFRLVHGGSEVFHVYHLHGGSDRWRFNPKADPTYDYAKTGLDKHPVEVQSQSARLDSQSTGPGESYSLEIENGAGGAQQGAGEFLFHCHIAHHYFAGMWAYWRVYDTLQPDLVPLPDRPLLPKAVTSAGLVGRTVGGQTLTAGNLDAWIRPQLPPQGVTRDINLATRDDADQDGSVWDWAIDPTTGTYLGEPDRPFTVPDGPMGGQQWPNFANVVPGHPSALLIDQTVQSTYRIDGNRITFDAGGYVGNRPRILFNPTNGRPAWPMLRPHIGKRPPFAPNGHSGAPYLGETGGQPADPALTIDPWANRPDGICPSGAPLRTYNVVAIPLPITVTDPGKVTRVVDPLGAVDVLAEDKAAVYAGTKVYAGDRHTEPLAIRGNIGDCIALTYTSELTDGNPELPFSKTNIHIHHVQFDTQASDGVISGFSFEQSIRPYRIVDPQLRAATAAGDRVLSLTSVAKFQPGVWIGVGLGTESIEIRQIESVDATNGTVTLTRSLAIPHPADQWAGTEFVQYRWYPDVALDNIFFHDHVNGIHGWSHGLIGQLLIEPAGSRWFDPVSGAEIRAGARADIRTDVTCAPRPDVSGAPAGTSNQCALIPGVIGGSFREFALWTISDGEGIPADPANVQEDVAEATLNLLAEPWADRTCGDPSRRFTASCGGDPFTPMLKAYVGDPVVIRNMIIGQGTNTLTVDGHRTFVEPRYRDAAGVESSPVDTIHGAVSERFTLILDGGAGGPNHVPGDYLYHDGEQRRFENGAWGLIRVLPTIDPAVLKPLPGHMTLPAKRATCPTGAPAHAFAVSAVDLPDTGAGGGLRRAAFVPTSMAAAVEGGDIDPEPIVMHVAAGECIKVTLTNSRELARASFHVGALLHDLDSAGVNVGTNPGDQTVAPGGTRTYTFFADNPKLESAAIADFGADGFTDGLYGSVVVAPAGAKFFDPVSGLATDVGSQVEVRILGHPSYRDFTLMLEDEDPRIGQNTMPYPEFVAGAAEINYRQVTGRPDDNETFSSLVHGDPPTPLLRAYAGDPVRVHVLTTPGSEQVHVFSLGGMSWPTDAAIDHSSLLQSRAVGPWEKLDAHIFGGAGGPSGQAGDYFYGDLRRPFTVAGMWGLFRVSPDTCSTGGTQGLRCLALPAPVITSVNPASGPMAGGTSVTITGLAFQGPGTAVTFGGQPAAIVSSSATSLVVTTPAHAPGLVDVVVTNADGQSATRAQAFRYLPAPPTISSLSPTSGPVTGGTKVTILGTGFAPGMTIRFGGVAGTSVTILSPTKVTVRTPAHAAGKVDVVVTDAFGQSATKTQAFMFKALAAPKITSLSPTSGRTAGGTKVEIVGTGFRAGMTITFGGVAGTGVTVVSSTKVTVRTPAHAAGRVDVVVTNPDGQRATKTDGYRYTNT